MSRSRSALRKKPLLLSILAFAAALSCSFDYDEAVVGEELAEEIPDSVMLDFSQTVVQEDGRWIRIQAERAEMYEKLDKMVVRNVVFEEFDAEGNLRTEGRAEQAVYHTDTENAEFKGAIVFNLTEEEVTLASEAMTWVEESRLLTTPPGVTVLLERGDGSFIRGQDLVADLRRMVVELGAAVQGSLVIEEESE